MRFHRPVPVLIAPNRGRRLAATAAVLGAVVVGSASQVGSRVAAATPASGSVSAAAPSSAWRFSPVVGQSADGRTIADNCPLFPTQCDNYDLSVTPTAPAGMQAVLTITYTWHTLNNVPEDLDVFDVNSAGTSGPGAPDNIESPGKEILTITSPVAGVHHIRSVAAVTTQPTPADATAVLSFRPTAGGGGGSGPTFVTTPVKYGPAAIVSAHFTSGEPQTTWEHKPAGVLPLPGALNPKRIFVDEPLSSRNGIGQLHRSLDGGDSFRLLIDPACALRSRPHCLAFGGGDTTNKVNLYDGQVYFGDQESVLQESFASSTDHGDTFPVNRQFPVTSTTTGDDRQWIAPVNAPGRMGGGLAPAPTEVRAFYSYHIPAVGEIIQGIDKAGKPILLPQPPQLLGVSQSGISRVDTTGGPGDGYIYQSYRDSAGLEVGVAPISAYQSPGAWKVGHVSSKQPAIFPWISLDSHGNAYAVWVTDGQLFLSYSLIDDPKNNPKATPLPGFPGTKWSPAAQINRPDLTSTVLPEVVAGDPGRIAVAYVGTRDHRGLSDTAPPTAKWNVYTAVITDALNSSPTVATGQVSHRVNHVGSICTSGTTCTGDRSLLDLIDLDVSSTGRVGVVFTDNNNSLARPTATSEATTGEPFIHYATEVKGPSLFKAQPPVAISVSTANFRDDPAGDATWPNVGGAPNLTSLDERRAQIFTNGDKVIARIKLGDTSAAQMSKDLAKFNAGSGPTQAPAQRLQYVMRFSTGRDVYHLSAEFVPGQPNLRFFGGKLDSNDGVTNGAPAPAGSFLGAGYHTDASFTVTGSVDHATNTITIRGRQSDFGVRPNTPLYSVTAFSMAGPLEALEVNIFNINRTVDATKPFDPVLANAVDPTTSTATAGFGPGSSQTGVLGLVTAPSARFTIPLVTASLLVLLGNGALRTVRRRRRV